MISSIHPISGTRSEIFHFRPWKVLSSSSRARQGGHVHPCHASQKYLRLRVTRGHRVLSLMHRRSKMTSLQSHGIGFFMHVLCKRIFSSFYTNCCHSRWNHFITLPLPCKILDCLGHTLMCLFETDACSSGQENNSAKRTLILSAVVLI